MMWVIVAFLVAANGSQHFEISSSSFKNLEACEKVAAAVSADYDMDADIQDFKLQCIRLPGTTA